MFIRTNEAPIEDVNAELVSASPGKSGEHNEQVIKFCECPRALPGFGDYVFMPYTMSTMNV